MNGQIREIPGYYYDKLKKKYFKVQTSSAAPASSAYSSLDIKRRKLEDERSEALALGIARQKGLIQRSSGLRNSPLSELLAGENVHSHRDVAQTFVAGLAEQGCFHDSDSMPCSCSPLFDIEPRPDIDSSRVDIRIVGDSYFTVCANLNDATHIYGDAMSNRRRGLKVEDIFWSHEYFGDPGESTSLSINKAHRVAARTWLADTSHAGISIISMASSRVESYANVGVVLGPGISQGHEVSVYSSTAAPPESNILFAFGTSHGIMTVDKRDYDAHFISPKPVLHETYPTDIFALEFLSESPSILLSGGRRGILNITDLRLPKFGSNADTIRHPSSITHIRQLDFHRILVSGLNSSLCQYDLRFRKLDTPPTPTPPRKKPRPIQNPNPTKSILEYPEFHNTASIQHGLDIDSETGALAVGQEHDSVHPPVQIFSLHGGHTLRSPRVEKFDMISRDQVVKCVQWVEDVENRAKSLYIGSNGIWRYAWTGDDDFD